MAQHDKATAGASETSDQADVALSDREQNDDRADISPQRTLGTTPTTDRAAGWAVPKDMTRELATRLHSGGESTCDVLGIQEDEILGGAGLSASALLAQLELFNMRLLGREKVATAVKKLRDELPGYRGWLDRLAEIRNSSEPETQFVALVRTEHQRRQYAQLLIEAQVHLKDRRLDWSEHQKMLHSARVAGLTANDVEKAYVEATSGGDFVRESEPPVVVSRAKQMHSGRPQTATSSASDRARIALANYSTDSLRVSLERVILARFTSQPASLAARLRTSPDVDLIRRELLAGAMRLSESMAPALHASAREAARVLGVREPIEIYQADGPENAAVHLVASPVVLEAQGRLLALLDSGSSLALFGHELGHFLVHGPTSEHAAEAMAMDAVLRSGAATAPVLAELRAFSMARELTADRFALLACQDLHAFLKLEMISTTGLHAHMLTWDTHAYLAQCKDLIERMLEAGDRARGSTHPEHSVRAYAAWLFSETQEYGALTGTTPGSRSLNDVDEVLERILREPFDDAPINLYEPVPREAHACALAAAVLVAAADGEVSEREIEAVEHAFGGLLPEWRSFLDVAVARERFFETGLVVTALGGSSLRAVFSVMVHVMFADEHVSPSEVEMILAVADALQARPMFEALLASTLESLGVVLDVTTLTPASLPLPVAAGEARAALDVFLTNSARRSTRVTPRRLLRLTGQRVTSPDVERTIREQIMRAGLVATPELSFQDLDAPTQLTPREAPTPAATQVVLDQDRTGLRRAIGRLRDELVSGDGRSPSVRLREERSGRVVDLARLDAVSTGLAERVLAQVQARKSVNLFDPALAARMPEARKLATELVALAREHKARLEETGADDLFVGYPLLAGAVDGYVVRGPLILYPVVLSLDAKGTSRFTLSPKEDEPFVNQSLLRLIFHKRKQPLSDVLLQRLDELAAEPGSSLDAVLDELRTTGIDAARVHGELRPLHDDLDTLELAKNVFRIDEIAVFGLFPQSSSSLLQEYDTVLQALEDPSRDIASLLGAASLLLPAKLRPPPTPIRESTEPVRPAIFADPSQRDVMSRARTAPALVVDGPPGTGKSQVIANLITDALARGERVAVVCEKRAALDVVVQRLDQLGMRALLGLVHDVHDDRRSLLAQVAGRIEHRSDERFDRDALARVEAEANACETMLSRRMALLSSRVRDGAPRLGELHTICSSFDLVPQTKVPSLVHLDSSAVTKLAGTLTELASFADVVGTTAEFTRLSEALGRTSFSAISGAALQQLTVKLARAVEATVELATFQQESESIEQVRLARTGLTLVSGVDGALVGAATRTCFTQIARLARATPDAYAGVVMTLSTLRTSIGLALCVHLPVRLDVPPPVVRALSLLQEYASRFMRFFSFSWWRARGTVRASLRLLAPERTDLALSHELVSELLVRVQASTVWRRFDTLLHGLDARQLTPLDSQQLELRLCELELALRGVATLSEHQAVLLSANAWPGDDLTAWQVRVAARLKRLEADDAARAARDALLPYFRKLTDRTPAIDVENARQSVTREGMRIADADRALEETARTLHGRNDQQATIDALRLLALSASLTSPTAVAQWLYKTWSTQLIELMESRAPEARNIAATADTERAHSLKLGHLEDERSRYAISRVWEKCESAPILSCAQPAKHQRRTDMQTNREDMLKEAKKQRRILPLRTYVQRFARQGLLDLVPVWLLSPETMVTLFPAQPLFDLVIFDEASQCTVANGFPVLSRAKRFVVAGDDKQMPPSAFFSARATHDDEADEESEVKRDKTMLEDESLLTLAAGRIERRSLSWHYRCRHESLIAFSNAAFYDRQLRTIPSPQGPASAPAMRWVHVPGGKYSEGVNEVEAESVVDTVAELLHRSHRTTVGVVTFNLKQRGAVLDAIDARHASSTSFAEAWDRAAEHADLDQRPFVKNLEQVQGDERDAIVFSLGHAPVERRLKSGASEAYVPARFGPLGQRGGERRLNVAVSRAKQEIHIVASFEPRLLNTAKAKNRGPALFKSYLEYALHTANGAHANAERMLGSLSEKHATKTKREHDGIPGFLPLAAQIGAGLDTLGVRSERDVGVSGFRIPLAVYAANDATRFRLAVLTDDGSDDAGVFETHVHRPRVLIQRGWEVLRVTSAEWNQARSGVITRIEAALRVQS